MEGGTAIVASAFFEEVVADPRIRRVTVFADPASLRQYHIPADDRIDVIEQPLARRIVLYRSIWKLLVAGRRARRRNADVLVSLTGQVRGVSLPTVVFIQQPNPYSDEALRALPAATRLRMLVMRWVMGAASRAAQLVIVQTPTMAQRVREAHRLPPDRVVSVMPTAARPAAPTVGAPALEPMRRVSPGKRLLYIGSDLPHKNLGVLARAMPKLQELLPGATLFMSLPPTNEYASAPHVVGLGTLDPSEVSEAYELSDLVCLSSVTETVGLSQLEAMAHGTPVLTADRPYAHDVCDDAAWFFNPLDPDDFAKKAAVLLTEQEPRRQLIEAGGRRIAALTATRPYGRMVAMAVELSRA